MIKKIQTPQLPSQAITPEKNSTGNPELDGKFREVALMYEKQFLREMTKAMRSTVQESGLVKVNQGERIFREQLDHEYVEKWGNAGGIGLSDMIYDQLVFKYGPKASIEKPMGPLNLSEKSNYSLNRVMSGPSGGNSFEFTKSGADSLGQEKILSPWSGLIQRKLDLGPDEKFLEMWHDNGLKSRFTFKGVLEPIQAGQKIHEGESLGYLSPETKNFFWNVSL